MPRSESRRGYNDGPFCALLILVLVPIIIGFAVGLTADQLTYSATVNAFIANTTVLANTTVNPIITCNDGTCCGKVGTSMWSGPCGYFPPGTLCPQTNTYVCGPVNTGPALQCKGGCTPTCKVPFPGGVWCALSPVSGTTVTPCEQAC